MKPLFSDKSKLNENITLIIGKTIISSDADVADTLNSFFSNTVKNLNINGFKIVEVKNDNGNNISKRVNIFNNHQSIIKMKANVKT